MKRMNEYAAKISPAIYTACPKAVFAAMFASSFFNSETGIDSLDKLILFEWQCLYDNGVVAQKPPNAQGGRI